MAGARRSRLLPRERGRIGESGIQPERRLLGTEPACRAVLCWVKCRMPNLTLRPALPDRANDWCVYDDGRVVGRMYEDRSSPAPWFWCLLGAAEKAAELGVVGTGRAPTLEAAKAAFRWSYEQWLARHDPAGEVGSYQRIGKGID